jgi:hypothetical protein
VQDFCVLLRRCVCQRDVENSVEPIFLDRAVFFLVDNIDVLVTAFANRHEESVPEDQHTCAHQVESHPGPLSAIGP